MQRVLDQIVLLFPARTDAFVVVIDALTDSSREIVSARHCRIHLVHLAGLESSLALEAWQKLILNWVVRLFSELLIQFSFGFFLTLAECILKELIRTTLLHGLLLQNILQQVLVPLDEPLRIDLPVLYLLLTVSLDALQQRL